MTQESNQPAAPPPLASWWGHTGLLYTGLTMLGVETGCYLASFVVHIEDLTFGSFSRRVCWVIQTGSILGLSVGIVQWFVLRRLVHKALRLITVGWNLKAQLLRNTTWWLVATIAGTVAGLLVISVLGAFTIFCLESFHLSDGFAIVAFLLCVPLMGLSLGLAQWLVLRRCVSHAGDWIWKTSGAIAPVLFFWALRYLEDSYHLYALSVGFALGAVQAACLKRLAPEWMKRLHDAAPADSATAEQRMTGSPE